MTLTSIADPVLVTLLRVREDSRLLRTEKLRADCVEAGHCDEQCEVEVGRPHHHPMLESSQLISRSSSCPCVPHHGPACTECCQVLRSHPLGAPASRDRPQSRLAADGCEREVTPPVLINLFLTSAKYPNSMELYHNHRSLWSLQLTLAIHLHLLSSHFILQTGREILALLLVFSPAFLCKYSAPSLENIASLYFYIFSIFV